MPNIEGLISFTPPRNEMQRVPDANDVSPLPDKKRIHLSPRLEEVLSLAALGLSIKGIGEKMELSPITVSHYNSAILNAFDVDSRVKAIVKGEETGNIDLYEATKDLNTNDISKLSKRERELLDTMTQNGGENCSNKKIASALYLSEKSVRNYFTDISKKLGINRTRAGLLYLAYKKANSSSSELTTAT